VVVGARKCFFLFKRLSMFIVQDEICLKMKFVIVVIKFNRMTNDGAKRDVSSGGLGRSGGVSP
jgi:hypothetical protein